MGKDIESNLKLQNHYRWSESTCRLVWMSGKLSYFMTNVTLYSLYRFHILFLQSSSHHQKPALHTYFFHRDAESIQVSILSVKIDMPPADFGGRGRGKNWNLGAPVLPMSPSDSPDIPISYCFFISIYCIHGDWNTCFNIHYVTRLCSWVLGWTDEVRSVRAGQCTE